MLFSVTAVALASALAVHATDFQVSVGANSTFTFDPPSVSNVQVGDTLVFAFHPKNHSVTQSTFAAPCAPMTSGVDSGFQPVDPASTAPFPEWRLVINDTSAPLWFHCAQTAPMSHCQQGMVFAVNPTADKSFAAFQAAAQSGAQASGAASSAGGASTGAASPSGGSGTSGTSPSNGAPVPSGFSTSVISSTASPTDAAGNASTSAGAGASTGAALRLNGPALSLMGVVAFGALLL